MSAPHITDPAQTIERMYERIHNLEAMRDSSRPAIDQSIRRSIAACRSVISRCVNIIESQP